MIPLELLAPAGSYEALTAAVQNGAGAVYLGYGNLNARRNAKNFTREELAAAVSYCHLRGVRVYLTLNTLITDRELPEAYETAAFAAVCGVDAVLVQDLGVLTLLRRTLPELPLHASTQMTIHNLPGAAFCRDLGLTRVVLSRELSQKATESLCRTSPLELEVFLHGALCMCYSGQCYFSALLGGRSGNRGLCAQPCRLPYRREGETAPSYPLSLKDLSLAGRLGELSAMGIACLKLEGRMKRPEYVAIVTGIFAAALREGREPTRAESKILEQAFSRDGFTQGYYTGQVDHTMFGTRRPGEQAPETLLAAARESYQKGERVQIPIRFAASIEAHRPAALTVTDPEGRTVTVTGPIPEAARTRPLTEEQIQTQLQKTGGTVFVCIEAAVDLAENLSLPAAALNALRREALEGLSALRTAPSSRTVHPYEAPIAIPNGKAPPTVTVSLARFSQLSRALLEEGPAMVWLPPEEIAGNAEALGSLMADYPAVSFGVTLPRVCWDEELPALGAHLSLCRSLGIRDALVGTWGLIEPAKARGFRLHGDFGLGVYNSLTLAALTELGFTEATASFELNLPQIRDLSKPLPTALIAYGRLPLMLMEHCLLKEGGSPCPCEQPTALTDRRGETFPVVKAWGCRSELLNAKTLFLGDKLPDCRNLGLASLRLLFTTEDAETCTAVLRRYLGRGEYAPPDFTRGLYYRKVE